MINNKTKNHIVMASDKTKNSNSALGIDEISTLLETLEKHEVTEFKLEREGEKVWLKRGPQAPLQVPPVFQPPYPVYSQGVQHVSNQAVSQPQAFTNTTDSVPNLTVVPGTTAQVATNKNVKEVRSPMVGTFYRRPAVDADAYVSVGDNVKKGDVLCIVEAMKLMNEIESEFSGKISEICLEDGQMVEYGEVIFKIEAA